MIALVVSALLAAELHLADVQLALDAPEGWSLDRDCGPVVPPDAKCRVDGAIAACPKTTCPERVGVLWVRSPSVLTSRDEERTDRLEADGGWVSTQPLKDGWIMTWGSDAERDVFPFKVSRKIEGRVIECSGDALTLAGQQVMIDLCKRLRPLPQKFTPVSNGAGIDKANRLRSPP